MATVNCAESYTSMVEIQPFFAENNFCVKLVQIANLKRKLYWLVFGFGGI